MLSVVFGLETTGGPYGIEHAWCVTRDGRLADPTWDTGSELAYLGLVVTAAYRRSVAEPCLLHPHEAGLRLLREGVPPHALADVGSGERRAPGAEVVTLRHLPARCRTDVYQEALPRISLPAR